MQGVGIHERVYNGYGQKTSKLSITNIGQYNIEAAAIVERETAQKAALKQAAWDQNQFAKSNHPSRLNLHMQKEFPETSQRLHNGLRPRTPEELKVFGDVGRQTQGSNIDFATTRRTIDERSWNNNKMAFNKNNSSEAMVHKIMCGTSELNEPERIFPQHASHQQLLGIDNKLVGTNAQMPAPQVLSKNRWLGNDLGWENNRGLKAEHPSFEDGKAERWPNPKGWNKNPGPLRG